ncbi:beta-lactamase family protein [Myxococcota bacterium]|nr:beta-lactamase family protein [Myxococcota bacterium]
MSRLPKLLLLVPLLACNDPGPAAVANDDDGAWPSLPDLDEQIVEIMEQDHVPGLTACITRDGETLWCQGYGWAEVSTERPALPDTPFLTASVSKTVVAIAVAQGVERLGLDLDARVDAVVPFEVSHPDFPRQDITLRRLASHSSGIADNWDLIDTLYTDGMDSPLGLGDYMKGYLTPGGRYYDYAENWTYDGPGGAAEYSNIGSALAAYAVEVAADQPFHRFCDTNIFAVLGMENTDWRLTGLDEPAPALPYYWAQGGYESYGHYGFPDYPSGQLRSSAEALSRLLLMIEGGGALDGARVLTLESVEALLSVQYRDLDPDQGLFWYRWELDGGEVWGHNGGEFGASTEILLTEDGVGLVVLMNAEGRNRTLEDVELALLDASGAL